MGVTSLRSDAGLDANPLAGAAIVEQQPGKSPPIRLESLAPQCLDDGASCGMRLHKFAARSADQVAALERAFKARNGPELARLAHTLKGVAADLAAKTLHARADELERSAAQGDLQQAGPALVRTCEEIGRCVQAAGELLARLSDERGPSG